MNALVTWRMSQTELQGILVTQCPCHHDDKVKLEYLVRYPLRPTEHGRIGDGGFQVTSNIHHGSEEMTTYMYDVTHWCKLPRQLVAG